MLNSIKINKFDYLLADDSEWEYDRIGIVRRAGKVYLVDAESPDEESGYYTVMAESTKSVKEVLEIGVEHGVFGKSDNGDYYYVWDQDGNVDVETKFFNDIK